METSIRTIVSYLSTYKHVHINTHSILPDTLKRTVPSPLKLRHWWTLVSLPLTNMWQMGTSCQERRHNGSKQNMQKSAGGSPGRSKLISKCCCLCCQLSKRQKPETDGKFSFAGQRTPGCIYIVSGFLLSSHPSISKEHSWLCDCPHVLGTDKATLQELYSLTTRKHGACPEKDN